MCGVFFSNLLKFCNVIFDRFNSCHWKKICQNFYLFPSHCNPVSLRHTVHIDLQFFFSSLLFLWGQFCGLNKGLNYFDIWVFRFFYLLWFHPICVPFGMFTCSIMLTIFGHHLSLKISLVSFFCVMYIPLFYSYWFWKRGLCYVRSPVMLTCKYHGQIFYLTLI